MRLILQVGSGPLSGKQIVVGEHESVQVGRTKKSTFATKDNFMSSQHFAVECEGESCRLRDLGSRNGTILNGKAVSEAILQNGDRIFAGHTDFVVKIEQVTPSRSGRTRPKSVPSEKIRRAAKNERGTLKPAEQEKESTDAARLSSSAPISPTTDQSVDYSTRDQGTRESELRSPSEPLPVDASGAMSSYIAATPEGHLVQLLKSQPEPLMALLDGTNEPKVVDLLRNSGEQFLPIYHNPKNLAITPYLVGLPRNSALIQQLVHKGWGKGWGVYLTCRLPLKDLREYFRQALMITTPDGAELFSRFYDPRFFRAFLEKSTRAEVEPFFGPISAYFMEAERPEILLEFTRSIAGVEKRGHLLSVDL